MCMKLCNLSSFYSSTDEEDDSSDEEKSMKKIKVPSSEITLSKSTLKEKLEGEIKVNKYLKYKILDETKQKPKPKQNIKDLS